MHDMVVRGFVFGVNLFTPCKHQKTQLHLLHLITYIIGMSEKHFSKTQVKQVILAIRLSTEWHQGHYRKDNEVTPYIVHPLEVAALLLLYSVYDFKLIVAAIIHDAVENEKDPAKRYQKRKTITRNFGSTVRAVVEVATKAREEWKRKLYYKLILKERRIHVAWRVKMLKMADCACNARTLDVFDEPKKGEKIAVIREIYPQISASLTRDLVKMISERKHLYRRTNTLLLTEIMESLKLYE